MIIIESKLISRGKIKPEDEALREIPVDADCKNTVLLDIMPACQMASAYYFTEYYSPPLALHLGEDV